MTRRSTSWPHCVKELDVERGTGGNYAFYLSIPPSQFPTVVQQLKRSGLSDSQAAAAGAEW